MAPPRRHDRADPEQAVDAAPPQGNPAQRTEHHRPRDHQHPGQHGELVEPAVAHGILPRPDEYQRNHDMPEGQPVGAVPHERRRPIGGHDPAVGLGQPLRDKPRHPPTRREVRPEPSRPQIKLRPDRNRRQAADHQPDHDERRPEPEPSEQPL